jgi:hypothetical protein
VATISGARGVLVKLLTLSCSSLSHLVQVVGGATGDDVVEFLDWDIRNSWRTLGRGSSMVTGKCVI